MQYVPLLIADRIVNPTPFGTASRRMRAHVQNRCTQNSRPSWSGNPDRTQTEERADTQIEGAVEGKCIAQGPGN